MRTTLSLDDDVAAQLERMRTRSDKPVKQIVNEALRVGLTRIEAGDQPATGPFTHPVSLGSPLIPIDDVSEAIALAEGEAYR